MTTLYVPSRPPCRRRNNKNREIIRTRLSLFVMIVPNEDKHERDVGTSRKAGTQFFVFLIFCFLLRVRLAPSYTRNFALGLLICQQKGGNRKQYGSFLSSPFSSSSFPHILPKRPLMLFFEPPRGRPPRDDCHHIFLIEQVHIVYKC